MRDVAAEAGVSLATVSYVMNGLDRVSPEVAARVRAAVDKLGYERNRAAHALKTGRSNVIGCILPTLLNPIFPEIAKAVQAEAAAHGYATILIDTGDDPKAEDEALRQLAAFGVDGAVAVLRQDFPAEERPAFPVTLIDTPLAGFDRVQSDHYAGGRLIADHIAALGHRRVGLLSDVTAIPSSRDRRAGLIDGAKGRFEIVWEEKVRLTAELGPAARAAIGGRAASLVVCVTDLIAISALSTIHDLGLAVPGDVSVIGFDDMHVSGWSLIGLTTVRQPLAELGRTAVDLVLRRIAAPDTAPETRRLDVSFVERRTTAPRG